MALKRLELKGSGHLFTPQATGILCPLCLSAGRRILLDERMSLGPGFVIQFK